MQFNIMSGRDGRGETPKVRNNKTAKQRQSETSIVRN